MAQPYDYILKRLPSGKRARLGFFGFGSSNRAIFEALRDKLDFDTVIKCDTPPADSSDLLKFGELLTGEDAYRDTGEDILFLSPSVRRDRCALKEALRRGAILTSDAEIFFEDEKRPIFAVTGSDGKSTVTELTSRLLTHGGMRAPAVGNIGTPFSLGSQDTDAFAVELSSFQLMYLNAHSTRCAITNITPNHLNWHSSFEEYKWAKHRILEGTGGAVLSYDNQNTRSIAKKTNPHSVYSSRLTYSELRAAVPARLYFTLDDGYIQKNGKKLIALSRLKRREEYNIQNMMCAAALTDGYVNNDTLNEVFTSFSGLEHRCELFLAKNGITFINSSIDTTPKRTASTLSSLRRRVRLILGGRGKSLSLAPLTEPLSLYAERIGIYGDMRDEIMQFLKLTPELRPIEAQAFVDFDSALEFTLFGARAGDTVILSPAATGYGEFRDYSERGRHFKDYITKKYK